MNSYTRHRFLWKLLKIVLGPFLCREAGLTYEKIDYDGPMLLVSNHVCVTDPIWIGKCLNDQIYFVGGEHLFRMGFKTRLLNWVFEPIPRLKGGSGMDAARKCLSHLREGHSVCLYAEGGQCWDGVTQKIFPATGKLAKISGAALVTYKIENGFFIQPRWRHNVLRGRVHCRPVNIYTPEKLKTMTPMQINEAIERDIAEDFWKRQTKDPVVFKGKNRAQGLHKMLYLCPSCRRIGGLVSSGETLSCSCGFSVDVCETGFFKPSEPFSNMAEWDKWEKERLAALDFAYDDALFGDDSLLLSRVCRDHSEKNLKQVNVRQFPDRIEAGDLVFLMQDITDMAVAFDNLLLLTCKGEYYQIRSDNGANVRKYHEFWQTF